MQEKHWCILHASLYLSKNMFLQYKIIPANDWVDIYFFYFEWAAVYKVWDTIRKIYFSKFMFYFKCP